MTAGSQASDTARRELETGCVGREGEIKLLFQLLQDGARAIAVHGICGIGKSTLLEAFATQAQARGSIWVHLESPEIEPTERGFLHALQACLGKPLTTPSEAAQRLGSLSGSVILTVDAYELLRLLDTWMRQIWVPLLPSHVQLILFSRNPPSSAWLTSLGYNGQFQAVTLGPLSEPAALRLMGRCGISRDRAKRIHRLTHGHPLALRLAASAITAWHDDRVDPEQLASEQVMEALTRLYLADIHDPLTRKAVEASSVTRRTTLSLLDALLPGEPAHEIYEQLRALPFVRLTPEGLYIHDLIRETLAASLRARDPIAYRAFKRAAWRQLQREIADADLSSLWRYTADLLYLLENPVMREAFHPRDEMRFVLEPAQPGDAQELHQIVERHEGPQALAIHQAWWRLASQPFTVVRSSDGAAQGFYCMAEAAALQAISADPALQAGHEHLRLHPVEANEKVLFLRRWLSRDDGELPSAAQAACFVDIKRTYIEMRPRLRRVYVTVKHLNRYGSILKTLFFRHLPECTVLIDDVEHHTLLLDFGPQSVDGWFARLASAELGITESIGLDTDSRELILEGQRVALTRLEFALFQYLHERAGKNVSREELIDSVWGYNYQGESNLVDVVIRALRKKLGDHASSLQAVRGVGYRYRN